MSMFNEFSCGSKDNEKECLANAKLVSLHARRIGKGQWSFSGPGSEKKWYCISEDSPQGVWDNTAERMLVEFAESVKTTSQMTRFRDAKVCNYWLQIRIDDHRIQSDYKYKSELQNPEGKNSVLGIASAW